MAIARKLLQREQMTEERLHAHWFGGPQVPFWNYDPAKITMGVEIEYFIARGDDASFTLATREDYRKVRDYLIDKLGYIDRNLHDQPGRVSKDTHLGFIAIKPDFAWHILEVSLPPRSAIAELGALIDSVQIDIDTALREHGLRRLGISCLPGPRKVELVGQERLSEFASAAHARLGMAAKTDPFCDPMFPAYTAATHVHLNAFNEQALSLWPVLFAIEAGAGEIYCRGKTFAGVTVESVRSEFLNRAMGADYRLKAIPDMKPQNISDYVGLMNSSTFAFPHDRFFPVRDVSYVRPSKYGTIEFRSACTAPAVEQIQEIVCWRVIQLVAAHRCLTSKAPIPEILQATLENLVAIGIVPESAARSIRQKVDASRWCA
jgi:hypothetical protein